MRVYHPHSSSFAGDFSRARPKRHRDHWTMTGTPVAIFLVALVIMFMVSGGMLWMVGYNYEGLTGSPLTKIHPATYLVVLTFLWVCFETGNPIGAGVEMVRRRPGCFLLFVSAMILFITIVSRSGPGMAGVVDSFMLPPIAVMLFAKADVWTREKIEQIIHLSLIANGIMGLFEFATKHVYFPFRLDGEAFPYETRASAFQGHPLGNATVTALYILALIGGGGNLSPWPRIAIIGLELMAMVAFGGRVALVTTLILGGLYGLGSVHRIMRSGRVPLLGMAAAVVALTLIPLIIMGLSVGGFFDALLMRFTNDGGSANARVEMIEILKTIPLRDLLVGPDTAWVESLRRTYGLEMGIENPIIRTILYQGIVVTALVTLAIGLFLYEVARTSRPGSMLSMIGFVIIVNTFESLAGKSTLLMKFAFITLALFRPMVAARRPISLDSRRNPDPATPRPPSRAPPDYPPNRFESTQFKRRRGRI